MPSNEAMGPTDGHATPTMAFPGGIHVPSLTFFNNDNRQEIDWELQERHFEFLITSGLHGSEYSGGVLCMAGFRQADSARSQS
jgi:4-hydroxy-2-oxoglutarate aldolase